MADAYPSGFPAALDTFSVIVDNTTAITANQPNARGSSIEKLEAKVGITGSAVVTSHDYLLTHLPGQAQNWDIGLYTLTATKFISNVATGTAPLTITSTTPVDNLGIYFDHATIASEAQGDLLYRGASAWARLGAGTAGQFLATGGAGANPSWTTGATGKVIAYSGDGNNNRTIAHGLGRTPIMVWIAAIGQSAEMVVWMTGMAAGYSKSFSSVNSTAYIKAVDATNITVGTDNEVNVNGWNYVMFVI